MQIEVNQSYSLIALDEKAYQKHDSSIPTKGTSPHLFAVIRLVYGYDIRECMYDVGVMSKWLVGELFE